MNFERGQDSSLDVDLVDEIPRRRRIRVRHSYPQALIDLAKELLFYLNVRDISKALDIPSSSIYRWRNKRNSSENICSTNRCTPARLTSLVVKCQQDGFFIPQTIIAMLTRRSDADLSKHIPKEQNESSTTQCASPDYGDEVNNRTDSGKKPLDRALQAIRKEYFRDFDSRELARLADMSRHHFIRTFGAAYGISPHQYLLKVRIEAAKRLLLHSTETIDVVAAATGFRSGACLNRTFTRMEGQCISGFCRVVKRRTHDINDDEKNLS
jgi:AraC-like DNA-binding protein